MGQVDDDVRRLAGGEYVTMETGTLGDRQFDVDVLVVQVDGVPAGLRPLLRLAEP